MSTENLLKAIFHFNFIIRWARECVTRRRWRLLMMCRKKKSASHVTLTTSRVEYFTHSWHSVKPGRRRWWRYSVECALINFWQSSHLGFVFWRENETRSVFRLTLNRLRKWSFNRNFIQFTSSIVAVNKCDRASQVETRKEKKALAIISATSHNVCAKSDDNYDYDDSSAGPIAGGGEWSVSTK